MNSKVMSVTPSVSLSITASAKEMTAAGREIFNFAAGEPDFDTPSSIKTACEDALSGGYTKYSPVGGIPQLCKAISEKLKRENGLNYGERQVLVSAGAKHSLFNIFMAVFNEGDEVIIPAPYWLSYPEMAKIAGVNAVIVHCGEKSDFKITVDELERAVTEKTKAVLINSPSNPIGVIYTEEELRKIAEVAVKKDILVISDEIYEDMVYDGAKHFSIGSVSDEVLKRTITVNGFSKTYAMTGWRLGYCAADEKMIGAMRALQSHSTSGANTFAQYGALEALRGGKKCVTNMLSAFAERRHMLYERLIAIDGITCVKPMGAFYMFPSIAAFGLDSVTFCEKLLEEKGVAAIPGAAFGSDNHIRFSYACSMDTIKKGMDRFEEFIESL